jgi:DNA-binding PadR family transcriptional regulator
MRLRREADAALKPRLYFILLALAAGERHGQAIAREVDALSDGQVRLWPATLYGSLDELLDMGWIAEVDDPGERPQESEKRRIFRLSAAGRRIVTAETDRLAALVRVARARVKPRTGAAS